MKHAIGCRSKTVTEHKPGLSVVSQQGVLTTGDLYGLRLSWEKSTVTLHRMRLAGPASGKRSTP